MVGIPELKLRSQIDQDGAIQLPLGGQLHVEGLTLARVVEQVRQLLPKTEFRRRNLDGREYPVILSPSEINVSVAEFRPVYLSGDVAKPGEQPFRPGLIVRQAIALAGGYDVMRLRMNNPFLEQYDLKGEYNSLWVEFAKEDLHIRRLNSELEDQPDLKSDEPGGSRKSDGAEGRRAAEGGGVPLPKSLTAEMAALERDKMLTRNSDFSKERTYLKEAVNKEAERIAILSEQQQKEQAGVKEDAEDLQRIQEIFQKGNAPITRVLDARRSLLLSSTRQLQTAALLAQIDRERQDFARRAGRLDDQRRLGILDELQQANAKLAGIKARLESTSEKLVYVGMVRSQLVGGKGSSPELTIFRKSADPSQARLRATEDTPLEPGDVVEVRLSADAVPGLTAR